MDSDTDHPDPTSVTTAFVLRIAAHHEQVVNEQLNTLRSEMRTIEREAAAKREGLAAEYDQRLDAMDKATDLLAADLRQVPTDLQLGISSVKELQEVKFIGIEAQFAQNDKETERTKAAADLAVNAAFAAADKAAAAQNHANSEAIRVSEKTTAEKIAKNEQTQEQGQKALSDKIEDDRNRMTRLENSITVIQSTAIGGAGARDSARSNTTLIVMALGVLIALIAAVVTIVATRSQATDTVITDDPVISTVTVMAQ